MRRFLISFFATTAFVFGDMVLILHPHSLVEWLFPLFIGALAGIGMASGIANPTTWAPDSPFLRVTPTGRLWPRIGRRRRDPAASDIERTPD